MESSALDSRHPAWGGITQTPKPLGGAKGLETFEPAGIRCPIGSSVALGVALGVAIGVALGALVVIVGVGLGKGAEPVMDPVPAPQASATIAAAKSAV